MDENVQERLTLPAPGDKLFTFKIALTEKKPRGGAQRGMHLV